MHANPFNVPKPDPIPDWTQVFGREAPLGIDVGCCRGEFLCQWAAQNPDYNALGIEIRDHFVDETISRAKSQEIPHVHAILANANLHFDALIPDLSVGFISVNFPDPWFKKRHAKRRVIREDWLDILVKKFQIGGEFHLMTDFEPIAQDTRELFAGRSEYENMHDNSEFVPNTTTGFTSERERIHSGKGDPIYRLHYRFRGL